MDPNEALSQLRAWAAAVIEQEGDSGRQPAAVEGAELFQALDQWLSRGGFKPRPWSPAGWQFPDDQVSASNIVDQAAPEVTA